MAVFMPPTSGLFAQNGKILGWIGVEDDTLSVRIKGRAVYGMLNNRRITESESRQKFAALAVPILSMIVADLCDRHQTKRVVAKIGEKPNLLQDLLDQIKKTRNEAEVFVLDLKPDEITENTPREIQAARNDQIAERMSVYREGVKKFAETVGETRNLAEILLRANLPRSMWGEKEVRKVLSSIKHDVENLSDDFEKFEVSTENTDRGSQYVMTILSKSIPHEKSSVNVIASKLIDNFFQMKGVMSKTAQTLHRLFDIDGVFKRATGYPTTWFFDSSIFYDFQYNFENLVKGLMRTSSLESEVIEPLFVWKVKVTGESQCPTI